MRVVLLGTPEFAIPSLRMLEEEGYEVPAVVCQPDRPRGRGGHESPCPAKTEALSMGLRVLCFERLRNPEGVNALRKLKPDVLVTAAYGQILSQKILDIPPLGCVNVHGSLLPRYRGPAPIQWAVIMGEEETGVTTMMTDRGVDTGDILLQEPVRIGPEETAGELSVRMAELGARVLSRTLRKLAAGNLARIPQDPALATWFPMLTREDGRIDWTWNARDIVNRIRGVNPWPGAYTTCGGAALKIWKAREAAPLPAEPGTVSAEEGGLRVAAGAGSVEILEVQAPGGRRMRSHDFLRGHPVAPGAVMGND